MDGILIIDKPEGITSHDVVARCRRILRTKRIGHTGTLDPFATGVVVILVGKATRLAQFLDKDAKEYDAIVRFGFETDTGDRTGTLKDPAVADYQFQISKEEIEAVLPEFRGEIWQTPPMYSAKKVEGKKLYELARKGIEIERQPVKITNYELRITNYDAEKKINDPGLETLDLGLKVSCSAGTYIRVLAEDIGKKIGVGAHLAELRRTKAGKFGIEKAVTLEKLEEIAAENKLDEILISMNEAVSHLAEIKLSAEEAAKIKNGMKLKRESDELKDGENLRLTTAENLLAIGFYRAAEKLVQPKLVLV
ncbi:MAG TPA: tRNA pseudouridine(55) synthase TruB [Pyrinomonadaceae bacterium]|jgi:tRNA pseudouridine55 synthase